MAQKADDNHTSNGQLIAADADSARPAEAGVVPFSKLARTVAALPLHQFISLNAAFAEASSRFRSSGLTAHDLWQHARNGQLTIAARRLLPDGTEQIFLFRSAFWHYFCIWPPSADSEVVPVQGRVRPRPILTGRWYFFVGRRRFDRLYSIVVPSKPIGQTPTPPRDLGGRGREYDHERLLGEALVYSVVHGWPERLSGEGGLFEKLAATGVKMPEKTTLYDIFSPVAERIKNERKRIEGERKKKEERLKFVKKPTQ